MVYIRKYDAEKIESASLLSIAQQAIKGLELESENTRELTNNFVKNASKKVRASDDKPFKSAKSVPVDVMDPYSLLALPAILQEANDSLKNAGKPDITFYAAITLGQKDSSGKMDKQTKFYDKNDAYNEVLKQKIQDDMEQPNPPATVFHIIAASPDENIRFPSKLTQRIEEIRKTLAGRGSYTVGPVALNEEEEMINAHVLKDNVSEPAKKLLEPIVRAYGGQYMMDYDNNDRNFISQQAFDAIKAGESTQRGQSH